MDARLNYQGNAVAAKFAKHKDAGHAGESPVRLNLVAAWREATVVSPTRPGQWG